jgi:hypothetical protein
MTQPLVFGSVAGAIIAWAMAEWWRDTPGRLVHARLAWTLGAAMMGLHSVAAFIILYEGSHATALAATARQTAALTGVADGSGIYVNYLFVAIWMIDALWWWIAPAAYTARPSIVSHGLRAVFLFMFVNGAFVFADGLMRALGAAAVVVAATAWIRHAARRQSPDAAAIG